MINYIRIKSKQGIETGQKYENDSEQEWDASGSADYPLK